MKRAIPKGRELELTAIEVDGYFELFKEVQRPNCSV